MIIALPTWTVGRCIFEFDANSTWTSKVSKLTAQDSSKAASMFGVQGVRAYDSTCLGGSVDPLISSPFGPMIFSQDNRGRT